MTRLREQDVGPIPVGLEAYDACLRRVAGVSLRQLACKAAGRDEASITDLVDRIRFAAIPFTTGLGLIGGFSDAVATIVSHLGFHAFVTESTDVAGMVEAVERGADVLMLADDDRFVAIAPGWRDVVDNTTATARGFVAGLELMKGGLGEESVLVLGCGPLGVAATRALLDRGASVALCDVDQECALAARRELDPDASANIRMEDSPITALRNYRLIFDATNAGSFIDDAHLTPGTLVAAPGMPCGLTPEAVAENRDRVLHDALEIGTATMAVLAAESLGRSGGDWRADTV